MSSKIVACPYCMQKCRVRSDTSSHRFTLRCPSCGKAWRPLSKPVAQKAPSHVSKSSSTPSPKKASNTSIPLKKVRVNIVGMKHRSVTPSHLKSIVERPITLKREPTNKFDEFAIQCWSDNLHFGYIEAVSSEKITHLLDESSNYQINVSEFDEYKVRVEISFESDRKVIKFEKIPDGDVSGIYQISFIYEGDRYCYFGQSNNINTRLQSHYRNLGNMEHHNDIMQKSWLRNKASFNHRIVERCPRHMDGFDKQVFLFRKEMYYIENSEFPTANKIDADLVITEESLIEIKNFVSLVKSRLKKSRESHLLNKERIGQKIIDVGIMKEEKFWDGYQHAGQPKKYLSVKASNVLTWLNKKRYGMMDYQPRIDRNHPMFETLSASLQREQNHIALIDKNRKFLDNFFGDFKNRGKFETCKIDDLDAFLKILDENS